MREDGITTWFPVSLKHILFDLSHTPMSRPRVLLICSQHLFGESMEMILRREKEIDLLGPWKLGELNLLEQILEEQPSVIVIADENLQSEIAAELTKSIIEQCPELSVIRTGLSENIFRIVSTHTLPARGTNLLETIRSCIHTESESDESR